MGEVHDRLLETFLDLVRIDSPSREEAACAAYCAQALSDIGCEVRFDDTASVTGSNTGNLIAELTGTTPGMLVLSAHLDTVEPGRGIDPVVADGRVTSAGDTVLGADDKSGVAAAIEALRRLVESGESRPSVRCVFSVQEEVGLLGAKALEPRDAQGDLCLVLDADGVPGGIVVSAPTHYTFDATFIGKASHAGVAPERGVSAIAIAADAIANLRLGRLDDETTANVGRIEGGTVTNVIPARVAIQGECRSRNRERVERVRQEIDEALHAAALRGGGSVETVWHLEYEGFDVSAEDPAVQLVIRACERAELPSRLVSTGGGSDANIFAAAGTTTLALSCGMQGVHGTSESIEIADLESLTRLCVAVARLMAAGEGAA